VSIELKPLSEVAAADIQQLIDAGTAEGKTWDFKLTLPGNTDADKKELLYDISSFANAVGGHLVFGIVETNGVATAINPLAGDPDKEIRRLEGTILGGVTARINGLHLRAIPVGSGFVVVIRIPRSWSRPHMVIFQGQQRFYARNSAGKYRLDLAEIRSLVLASETLAERIRNFRLTRLAAIIAEDTPVPLESGPKMILHIVPLGAFEPGQQIDLRKAYELARGWPPLGLSGYNRQINFDGLLTCRLDRTTNKADAYLQLYRNGIVETVNAETLGADAESQLKLIPSISFEEEILQFIPHCLSSMEAILIELPAVILLSLTGVKGYGMATRQRMTTDRIDRDILQVPELLIEDYQVSVRQIKLLLDPVWNAVGLFGSPNFDSEGNRHGPQ
jgi:hypothetical protein